MSVPRSDFEQWQRPPRHAGRAGRPLDQVETDWLTLSPWIAIPNSLICSRFFITWLVVSPLSSLFSRCFMPRLGSSSYLPHGTEHRSRARNCRPNFLDGLSRWSDLLFVIGIVMAILILIAGRSLALRKRYTFALVMACIECLFVPFGTILGVFTIVVLSREPVRALFSKGSVQSAG